MTETPKKSAALCPICQAPAEKKFRPFCSKRCADVDLGRWFNESYAVPATEPPDEWDAGSDPDEGSDSSGGTQSLLH